MIYHKLKKKLIFKIIIYIILIILISFYFNKLKMNLDHRVYILNPYVHKKYNNIEITNYNIFNMTLILKNGKIVKYNIIKKYLIEKEIEKK